MIKDIINNNAQATPNANEMAVLRRYFPSCFTNEGLFDIALFEAHIKGSIDTVKEGYALNFLGKDYARLIASMDTTTVICPDEEHNSKAENKNSENVYISGDNIDALHQLLKSYTGKIKCIYIDPPYNTGSDDFVYNDKFSFTKDDLVTKLSISEEQANKILDLTKRGSASHSAWLTFMAPRLQLAKDLLSEDGVIFISIDDNEQANLKLLCDATFGEENRISQIIVQSNPRGRQSDTFVATVHEYLICYAKNITEASLLGEKLTDAQKAEYDLDDGDGRKYRLLGLRQRGVASLREDRPDMFFPIYVNPSTLEISIDEVEGWDKAIPKKSDGREGRWMWGKDKCTNEKDRLVAKLIARRNEYDIFVKDYLVREDDEERTRKIKSLWVSKDINNQVGTQEVKALLGGDYASYPKSSKYIKTILNIGTESDSVVLDFFSGSGTTADAIMQLNAEDGGARKYILVQIDEKCKDGSKAKEAGFKTLDQIGIKRIIEAGKKVKQEVTTPHSIDIGFKHYTLKEVPQNTLDKMDIFDPNVLTDDLNIKDQFGVPSILTTWLVRDGYGFNAPFETIKLDTYNVYCCGQHMYFIDDGLTEADIIELVDLFNRVPSSVPSTIVLFGYSFVYHNLELVKKNLRSVKIGEDTRKLNIDVRY